MNSSGLPVERRSLRPADGGEVACVHLAGSQPGVLFCGGFNSDMQGNKALALQHACAAAGRQFTRFDYRGHGLSSGKLEDHKVSDWVADAELVMEQAATGPLVIVGSSMGAWIACLLIKKFPKRFKGFVGVAAAPDFTEDIMLLRLDEAAKERLAAGEIVRAPTEYDAQGYPIRQQLIDDGRQNLVLTEALPVDFPVRLLHGTCDESVPWQHGARLMDVIQGDDVQLRLFKGGDHRLSEPAQLEALVKVVIQLT